MPQQNKCRIKNWIPNALYTWLAQISPKEEEHLYISNRNLYYLFWGSEVPQFSEVCE